MASPDVRALFVGVLLAGCNPPVREAVGVPVSPAVASGPSCAPTPDAALALVNDAPCPWALVAGEGSVLALRSGDGASGRNLGVAVPDACAGLQAAPHVPQCARSVPVFVSQPST